MRIPLLFPLLMASAWAAEQPDFLPPADAGVINVRAYGAQGDGRSDDTAALTAAIVKAVDRESRYATPPLLYLPAGTYLISGPLEARTADRQGWSSGWRSGFLLSGQGRSKTVIRLKDGCAGYGDAAATRWVLATGSEADGQTPGGDGNRAFRHAIMNLTVDVGAGNPGAVAIDFLANNRGTIENVALKAGRDSGACGLAMDRRWPGPALVKNLSIEGFATGVSMFAHSEYSMTFEDLALSGQREVGMNLRNNAAFIRHLTYAGAAPAIRQLGDRWGLLVLAGATLTGQGAKGPAISVEGMAEIRDLTCRGFPTVIDDRTAGNRDVAATAGGATTVASWRLGPAHSLSGPAPVPLNLPIEETPLYWPTAATEWVNGAKDLQAAVDSGKAVVYLPNGSYTLEKTLIIRGAVRKIVGFQSALAIKDAAHQPLIRFEGSTLPVILEHLWLDGEVEHACDQTLVLRHCDLNGVGKSGQPSYRSTDNAGRTFIEDCMVKPAIGRGHRLWARQLNAEFGGAPLVINRGGRLWILGFKSEGEMTVLLNEGGDSELLGALVYPLRPVDADMPAILNDGGRVSASWANSGAHYALNVKERLPGGAWREERSVLERGMALYASVSASAASSPAR